MVGGQAGRKGNKPSSRNASDGESGRLQASASCHIITLYENREAASELIVHEHALKHGLDPVDIEHAWFNFAVKAYRGAPNEGEVIAVGYDGKGRFMELVGIERAFGTVIIHAMAPPTRNALRELGIGTR